MTAEPGSQVAPSLFAPLGPTYDRYARLLSLGQDPRWRRFLVAQLDPRGEPAGGDASARDGEHVGAPVDADDRAAVLPDELHRNRARAGGDVQHASVRSELEPCDQEPTPAWVLVEGEKSRIAVVGGAEGREEGRCDAAAWLCSHGIVSTILPSCSPASNRSCAARISESGNVESTCTRALPLRTSP